MTQIIQTRYRDIPWEEARKCEPQSTRQDYWESVRGKPVQIKPVPFFRDPDDPVVCKEPNYWVSGKYLAVCPHIAEIGD